MALYFSTWLRETARLYLRYMAVAAASIPFSVVAVWAARAGWHGRLVLSLTFVSGLSTAFVIWKWLRDWQLKPTVVLSPSEIEWANLLNATISRGELLQYRLIPDENALLRWQDVMFPAVTGGAEARMIELSLNLASQAGPEPILTFNYDDLLQQMMMGMKQRRQKPRPRPAKYQVGLPLQISPAQTLLRQAVQPMVAGSH
jgi:hypothetical protein